MRYLLHHNTLSSIESDNKNTQICILGAVEGIKFEQLCYFITQEV